MGEQILNLINPNGNDESSLRYRKPNLGAKLDGASRQDDINRVFGQIDAGGKQRIRAGINCCCISPGTAVPGRQNYNNNMYDLWEEGRSAQQKERVTLNMGEKERATLTVRDLAHQIARLPNDVPVTLVMVQCFSGSFANLIFDNGDPTGRSGKEGHLRLFRNRSQIASPQAAHPLSMKPSTGILPVSSFAALTGRDRVGRRVAGADYNGDGRVGMDEAYCYTLIHDDSIDAPVCTSDVFCASSCLPRIGKYSKRRTGTRGNGPLSRNARLWDALSEETQTWRQQPPERGVCAVQCHAQSGRTEPAADGRVPDGPRTLPRHSKRQQILLLRSSRT